MSRPKRRDPRRNVLKPQVDKLEIRWLMSQAHALAGSRQARELLAAEIERVGGALGRTITTEFVRWEARHTASSSGSSTVALETFEAEKLTQGGLGPWGGLRLLVAMEGQGDHQFDELYQQLSSRFERWSMVHPNQYRLTGINPGSHLHHGYEHQHRCPLIRRRDHGRSGRALPHPYWPADRNRAIP